MKSRLLVVLVMALYCFPIYALHITYRYDTSTLSFAKDTTEYGVFEKVVWDMAIFHSTDQSFRGGICDFSSMFG